jgi:hypothetical protein
MSRRRLYTCITRARELNNITFFVNKENVINNFEMFRFAQHFTFKVSNYKTQDCIKNRTHEKDDDYIDAKWFKDQLATHNFCKYCNNTFTLHLDDDNKVICDITADRIDNNKPHLKNNCVLSCITCNCSRSNK